MPFKKRHIVYFLLAFIVAAFLSTYQLPYYIYTPGSADPLTSIVEVEGGYESEGEMHLVTVSGGQATPLSYLFAKIFSYHDIYPLEQIRPEGVSEEEYIQAQLQMMESSQEASVVVAYEVAEKEVTIDYEGVYVVSVEEEMPAFGKLEMADRIVGIDGQVIKEASDLIDYIDEKEEGDVVTLEVIRNEEHLEVDIELARFKDEALADRVGIGIHLVTDREVTVDPPVHFSSGKIGGPSAGLMFALEIYDQLTEEDLTKGYKIIGTGEIDYEGNVHRIGGVDKKVIAADRAGCDIFFVPFEQGAENSNYEVAKKTAEEINTDMKIVPVDTFEEALTYLKELEPKQD